jgi:hypothetical protein
MGFEVVLEADMRKRGFGSQRYVATGKERPHISKSKAVESEAAEFLKLGESKFVPYSELEGRRYIAFENLGYDFIITLYDVNAPKAYAIRAFESKDIVKELKAGIRSMMTSMPNIEARIIGLQSKEEHAFLKGVMSLLLKEGIRLIEVDLFGDDIRHIAIDLKTGASYNMLLEDRIYRPGELINKATIEDFGRTLIKPEKA